jgi:quercetin dioxygenase-like cupin family protein
MTPRRSARTVAPGPIKTRGGALTSQVDYEVDTETGARPLVRRPGEGQLVSAPAGQLRYKARGAETGGAVTVLESVVAPGDGPPRHVHLNDDEFIYVLDGRLRVRLEEAVHEAPAGSFMFFPKGVTHTWRNAGDSEARLLVVFAPAAPGMERFFERSSELADETRPSDAFKRFASDAGMTVLGPPLAD